MSSLSEYIFRHHYVQVFGGIIIAFSLSAILLLQFENGKLPSWVGFVDNWISILTFLVALLIWYTTMRRNYRNDLPNRLTVKFVLDGRQIARCEDAYLTDPADIRAWGMQIGKQMFHSELLLEPFFHLDIPRVVFPVDGSAPFERHVVTFFLTGFSKKHTGDEQKRAAREAQLRTGTLVWRLRPNDGTISPGHDVAFYPTVSDDGENIQDTSQ